MLKLDDLKVGMKVRVLSVDKKCQEGFVGKEAVVVRGVDRLNLDFEDGIVGCRWCGTLETLKLEGVSDTMMYNGKPVVEYEEGDGSKYWKLENGNLIFEMPSTFGFADSEAICILDEDSKVVTLVYEVAEGESISISASADEIGGEFKPLVLKKIVTARMLRELSDMAIREMLGKSDDVLDRFELKLTLAEILGN